MIAVTRKRIGQFLLSGDVVSLRLLFALPDPVSDGDLSQIDTTTRQASEKYNAPSENSQCALSLWTGFLSILNARLTLTGLERTTMPILLSTDIVLPTTSAALFGGGGTTHKGPHVADPNCLRVVILRESRLGLHEQYEDVSTTEQLFQIIQSRSQKA